MELAVAEVNQRQRVPRFIVPHARNSSLQRILGVWLGDAVQIRASEKHFYDGTLHLELEPPGWGNMLSAVDYDKSSFLGWMFVVRRKQEVAGTALVVQLHIIYSYISFRAAFREARDEGT